MQSRLLARGWRKPVLTLIALLACSSLLTAQAYQQINLDSDFNAGTAENPGLAPNQSPHLLNPWGLISSSTSPWWIADNNGGVSTLYNGNTGALIPLVVNIPPVVGGVGTGTPTGVVFTGGIKVNGTTVPGTTFTFGGSTAVFSFVSEDGRISAWPGHGDAVQIVPANNAVPDPNVGPVYKGATVASMTSGGPLFLYVTNFRQNKIEVYDNNFNPVTLSKNNGHDSDDVFTDHQIPRGFAPFNIQEVNGNLYVTYAKQTDDKHDDFDAPGLGFVDKFSPTGKLLQRLDHGKWLNAPWGIALATDFGFYSNHLFVGNAGSGQIAVYDADSGHFDGLLRDNTGANGHALQNDRLWALRFGNDAAAGPHNWLFFTAGILGEQHGLFGFFVPDPNSAITVRDDNGDEF